MSENISSSSSTVCFEGGGWDPQWQFYLWQFPFHTLQLQFLVVFCITQSLHHLIFKHFGLPPLVSQLMAGILLSPSVLIERIKVLKTAHKVIFPTIIEEVWQTVATLGLSLFLFLIAVKMDFTIIRRNGKKPFAMGLLMLVVPGIANKLIARIYGAQMAHLNEAQTIDLTSCASILGLTAFPVIAILLGDLNLLQSELGRLALSSGIVSELGSILLILFSRLRFAATHPEPDTKNTVKHDLLQHGVGIICVVLLAVFLIRPVTNLIIKWTPKGRPIKDSYLVLVILFTLVGAIITHESGELVMLGCFIVGATVPEGPPLGSAVVQKFESFIFGMLMPFFITSSIMMADFSKINFNDKLLQGQILVTFSACASKIVVCIAYGWFYNLSVPDALALAAIMCSKGIIDIFSYVFFHKTKLIQDSSFAYLIIVVTVIAIVAPIAIKLLYDPLRKYGGYQRRDIMHSKGNTLRILACIHRPDNVSSLIKLLSFYGIRKENKVVLNVLHLIKLVGRAQPVFISHDLQQRKASSVTYSEDVIWTLNAFHNQMDGLSMHLFTTVSPPKSMHEDICTLALDKLVSLIILPFHRKITIDWSADLEDHAQRILNYSILERAPCSVGILIDRGSYRSPAALARLASNSRSGKHDEIDENDKITVGVIFIGGNDDREAVAYAKRMAQAGKSTKVVVIQIVALGENGSLNLLDSSALSGIQEYSSSNRHFDIVQKVVTEGSETAMVLRAIVEDFDLILVGRRYNMDCAQTSGLKEWTEVPELGILGDLLASPDLRCKTSIMVIQQQRQWTWKD